jgi:transposase
MARHRFTPAARAALRVVARHAADPRVARRAQALLDLAGGNPVAAVARRYGVSREALYDWLARLATGRGPLCDRLADRPRAGRPARLREAAVALVRRALATRPTDHGYRHPTWTVPLLRRHLARAGVAASPGTVRRVLRRLGFRWKRPRHRLSRRPRTWRQAKGG